MFLVGIRFEKDSIVGGCCSSCWNYFKERSQVVQNTLVLDVKLRDDSCLGTDTSTYTMMMQSDQVPHHSYHAWENALCHLFAMTFVLNAPRSRKRVRGSASSNDEVGVKEDQFN